MTTFLETVKAKHSSYLALLVLMADPLSITTAIVTLLGAGGCIGKVLKKVVNLKHHAPDILLAVNNEITDLRDVVQIFDDLLQRQYNTSDAAPYGQLSVSLDKVKRTLLKLEQLFSYELTVVEGDDLHLRLDKSAWLLAEPKFRAIKDQIREDKTALYRGLAVLTHCMIEYLSRRLHVSVKTFEERMLQAHDHVVEELQLLGYAVQNVSDQQKQQGHSLRQIQQDTALVCQDGDQVDGLVFAGRNSVREKGLDQYYLHQRFQHNVGRTTTHNHRSGHIAFGDAPIESEPLVSIKDQHPNQVQLSGSIEQELSYRNTEKMFHPATKSFSSRVHAARPSPNDSEPSDPNLLSGQLQSSITSFQPTTSRCRFDCRCSCHRRSRFRSPSLLGNVIGSLSVGYHTSPWAASTCNSPSCRHRLKEFTYIYAFPQWLSNRILHAHLAYSQSRGPELCLRMLRVRSKSSDIFRLFYGPQSDEMIMTAVRRLFDNGEASVLDIDEDGASVLHWAIIRLCHQTIKLLIAHGADHHLEDSFGMSPFKEAWTVIFSKATSSEYRAILQQLFWDQSHFDVFQFTQLHKAYLGIAGATFDMVLAWTGRADVDGKDATGRTTLSWACQRGDPLAISQLLRYGANPDMSDSMGRTPLHWVAESSSIESMRLLLAAGADMELQDSDGRTSLAFGWTMYNIDLVKLLLGAGSNIESQDLWLRRPLHHAALLNLPQIAKLLIERGADVDAKNEVGYNAFEIAISRRSQKWTKRSLCPTDDATSPVQDEDILFLAALYGNEEWLRKLHAMRLVDVDLTAEDEEGMTALETAEWRRDNTSTCSKGSPLAPKRDMSAWFEAFKALWDDIETRQGSNRPLNNNVTGHVVDAESAGESGEDEDDEDDEVWEEATESQNPAPA